MRKIYLLAAIALLTKMSFGAELFVRVVRPGYHIATAYNQTQSNTTNIYRFFELPGGSINLQISDQQSGLTVHNSLVNLASNQRIVAELDVNGILQIIQTCTITNTNWYTSVSTCGGVSVPNNPGNGYPNGTAGANDPAFNQFLSMLEEESFDSKRLETAKSYAEKTMLSAQQITDISKKFTFDSYRLDWAKFAYAKCYDKANYFLLKNTFTFSSNYSALEEYIEGQ